MLSEEPTDTNQYPDTDDIKDTIKEDISSAMSKAIATTLSNPVNWTTASGFTVSSSYPTNTVSGSLDTATPRQAIVGYLKHLDKQISQLESMVKYSASEIKSQIDSLSASKLKLAALEKERNLLDLFIVENM